MLCFPESLDLIFQNMLCHNLSQKKSMNLSCAVSNLLRVWPIVSPEPNGRCTV